MARWFMLPKLSDGKCAAGEFGPDEPFISYFRREITLSSVPASFKFDISADTRYKLYVNGTLAELGPAKGDSTVHYFDTVDIGPLLSAGENCIGVEVLRYSHSKMCGNFALFRSEYGMLYINACSKQAETLEQEGFKCIRDTSRVIPRGFDDCTTLFNRENVSGEFSQNRGWKLPGFDDSGWEDAGEYSKAEIETVEAFRNLTPRRIPFMNKIPRRFAGSDGGAEFDGMLRGDGRFTVKAGTSVRITANAGEEMTGQLRLDIGGGKGGTIRLTYAECYMHAPETGLRRKTDRTDSKFGHIEGACDNINIGGPCVYEPFFFKTFRYIALDITAAEEDIVINGFDYKEVGYPLDVKAEIKTDDPVMNKIWDISLRTLRRCMHETYEDCPYYEQLQYAQDSRSQILFTYSVAYDDRLAKNCMDDFRRSQHPDGLLNSRWPDFEGQTIPGFSLYYIFMVHDHMMYFGEKELAAEHLPCIRRILDYFEGTRTPMGLVGKIGDRIGAEKWSFIDWTPEWGPTGGMPLAGLNGPITMESLLYILALEKTADLCDFLGETALAAKYRANASSVRDSVNLHCTDSEGVYLDGPKELYKADSPEKSGFSGYYSQHCQAYALLAGCCDEGTGRKNLLKSLHEDGKFAKCSVSTMFYLFRALEKAGIYEETEALWEPWREMVRENLTTCVENDTDRRSDCHAWGALALYEIPAVMLGIRPAAPGFAKISDIKVKSFIKNIEGTVPVKGGTVRRTVS